MARQHADAIASFEGARDDSRDSRRLGEVDRQHCCCSAWAARTPSAAPSSRSTARSASKRSPCRSPSNFASRCRSTIAPCSSRPNPVRAPKCCAGSQENDGGTQHTFGLTLEGSSSLAKAAPSLVGAGGTELAFAATRSLTVSFALHLAILAALGQRSHGRTCRASERNHEGQRRRRSPLSQMFQPSSPPAAVCRALRKHWRLALPNCRAAPAFRSKAASFVMDRWRCLGRRSASCSFAGRITRRGW